MVYGKKADFKAIGDRFGVDQVVARIARNRGNETEQDFDMYFNKTTDSIHNYLEHLHVLWTEFPIEEEMVGARGVFLRRRRGGTSKRLC